MAVRTAARVSPRQNYQTDYFRFPLSSSVSRRSNPDHPSYCFFLFRFNLHVQPTLFHLHDNGRAAIVARIRSGNLISLDHSRSRCLISASASTQPARKPGLSFYRRDLNDETCTVSWDFQLIEVLPDQRLQFPVPLGK